MAEKPRVKVPASVKPGEVFEVKTLLKHPMEPGVRKDASGNTIPRKIINRFACKANGREVFAADLFPATAADPFLTFHLRLKETSKLEFSWTDDDGSVTSKTVEVKVA
jgi:sulfur-oxidizing protein SoxZ